MCELITVIVPFYCTPKELYQCCINSILFNNIDNIEVLVIDDGSPENYQETLKYEIDDKRMRVINAPHAGVSAARNRGIIEAKGKWITFVDSDDYIDGATFKKIVDNLSGFYGDVELFNGGLNKNGEIISNTSFLKENYNYGEKQADKVRIMESALSAGKLSPGYIQTFSYGSPYCKLFRKKFIDKNNLRFDENVKFAEDVLFLLHVYHCATTILYHDWFFYNYVENVESSTRKFRPGISSDMDVFFERIKIFLQESDLEKDLEKAYFARAQFEVRRSFYLEFFNPSNSNPNAKKLFKAFIQKEPYSTALKKDYLPKRNFKSRLYNYFIEHGFYRMYKITKIIQKRKLLRNA